MPQYIVDNLPAIWGFVWSMTQDIHNTYYFGVKYFTKQSLDIGFLE